MLASYWADANLFGSTYTQCCRYCFLTVLVLLSSKSLFIASCAETGVPASERHPALQQICSHSLHASSICWRSATSGKHFTLIRLIGGAVCPLLSAVVPSFPLLSAFHSNKMKQVTSFCVAAIPVNFIGMKITSLYLFTISLGLACH